MTLDPELAHLPALIYLAVITLLLVGYDRVPATTHAVLLTSGLAARTIHEGILGPLISSTIALVTFIVLVGIAGRTLSGVSLFAIAVTAALLPLHSLPFLLVGIGTAGAVALWRTWRHLGAGRVAWLTMDTMSAMGVSPSGQFKMPELALVPDRDALSDVRRGSPSHNVRMYLPPYLLLGVALATLAA